jgi:hypothetical protein
MYKDLKKYRGALRIATIGLVILPNFQEEFMQQWTAIKYSALLTEKCKDVQVCKCCNLGQNYLFHILLIRN